MGHCAIIRVWGVHPGETQEYGDCAMVRAFTSPDVLTAREKKIADVFMAHHPVRGSTHPIMAVEWYDMVRDMANTLFGSETPPTNKWVTFASACGYYV